MRKNNSKKETLFQDIRGIKKNSVLFRVLFSALHDTVWGLCWCDGETLSQKIQSTYGGLVTKTTAVTKRTKSRPNLIIVIVSGIGEAKDGRNAGSKVIVI